VDRRPQALVGERRRKPDVDHGDVDLWVSKALSTPSSAIPSRHASCCSGGGNPTVTGAAYGGSVARLEKLAVVGAGSVGAAVAYASMIDRLADEIALFDIDGARAEAESLDLRHGLQFVGGGRVRGGDDVGLCAGADLVVVTAGATHGPGGSRLELAGANVALVRRALPPLLEVAPDAIYLLVTNPVDVVTYVAQELSGLPHGRVIGSGTVLDSSRLRHVLAERLGVSVANVHALVVGEHGDSETVLWSSATVGGTPMTDVVGPQGGRIRPDERDGIRQEVREAADRIIRGKGNTNLAIGLATAHIARAISRDECAVLPVSVRTSFDGVGEVCLSVPSVVGRAGVLSQVPAPLDDAERADLRASAVALRGVIDSVAS
jgi:L-lactate dehydrogenase